MMEQVLLLGCGWDNYHLRCTISPGQTHRLLSGQAGRVWCSLMYSHSDLSSAPLGFVYIFIHFTWLMSSAEWRDIEGAAFSTLMPGLLQRCPPHLRLRKIDFMQMYPSPIQVLQLNKLRLLPSGVTSFTAKHEDEYGSRYHYTSGSVIGSRALLWRLCPYNQSGWNGLDNYQALSSINTWNDQRTQSSFKMRLYECWPWRGTLFH